MINFNKLSYKKIMRLNIGNKSVLNMKNKILKYY